MDENNLYNCNYYVFGSFYVTIDTGEKRVLRALITFYDRMKGFGFAVTEDQDTIYFNKNRFAQVETWGAKVNFYLHPCDGMPTDKEIVVSLFPYNGKRKYRSARYWTYLETFMREVTALGLDPEKFFGTDGLVDVPPAESIPIKEVPEEALSLFRVVERRSTVVISNVTAPELAELYPDGQLANYKLPPHIQTRYVFQKLQDGQWVDTPDPRVEANVS